MSGTYHAKLSPSGAPRWMQCPASVPLSENYPRSSSDDADYGTAAHWVAAECLTNNVEPESFLSKKAVVPTGPQTVREILVDQDMVEGVERYVELVRKYADGGELLVECAVPIDHLTGERDATGTSDVVVIMPDELRVIDLKFGYNQVMASSPQLKMYASGARREYGALTDCQRVVLVIIQPRINHVDEVTLTAAELDAFEEEAKTAAEAVKMASHNPKGWRDDPSAVYYEPSDSACKYCPHAANCPALRKSVEDTVGMDFETLAAAGATKEDIKDTVPALLPAEVGVLAKVHAAADLIDTFISAVRAEVARRLHAGEAVDDGEGHAFKLVRGRQGNREYVSEETAENLFSSFRLKEAEKYNFKLKSPAQMEKILKKDSPRRWAKVCEIIEQKSGKLVVAPMSDLRPAEKPDDGAEGFASTTEEV